MGATRRTRSLKSESGAELVELALTLPMLLFVLLAIADFGFVFQKQEIVANAAREGARLGAISSMTDSDVQTRVTNYMTNAGLTDTTTVTVTPTTLSAAGGTFQMVQVDVSYPHTYTFLGPLSDWFGGGFSSVPLSARAVMRRQVGGGGT